MPLLLRAAWLSACLISIGTSSLAQSGPGQTSAESRRQTAVNAQLFYQVLLGEMNAAGGDTGAAISLLLDAARKTQDEKLFQRAADLALGARSGETALQVVRSWRQALPQSLPAARYQLQIMIGLNRTGESAEALKAVIELTPAAERNALLNMVPTLYSRASDKKLAATVVEQALASALADAQTAAAAWSAVGRTRALAGDTGAALEASRRALAADWRSLEGLNLALELMAPGRNPAEALVRRYLEAPGLADERVRLGYARNLLDQQRYAEALLQLNRLTSEHPQFAEGWLVLGSLQMDQPQTGLAQASLQRYLELSAQNQASQQRGRAQARLMLAQLAERQGDLAQAARWLDQVQDRELLVQIQARRASLLARQGQLAQGRALIQQLPEQNPQDARRKLLAEVQLLRDFKDHASAYELMQKAVASAPQDHELIYEKSLLAEKLGRMEEMERLLRLVMQIKPDYHGAYNALGYSLADRGLRLQEARQLIKKALEYAPDDPYIQDSLAWVEFRMGNAAEALRVIEIAYKAKPDAEIAAHFGEILWSLGQRDRARSIWREGLMLNADNDTLKETLKRLQVQP